MIHFFPVMIIAHDLQLKTRECILIYKISFLNFSLKPHAKFPKVSKKKSVRLYKKQELIKNQS